MQDYEAFKTKLVQLQCFHPARLHKGVIGRVIIVIVVVIVMDKKSLNLEI